MKFPVDYDDESHTYYFEGKPRRSVTQKIKDAGLVDGSHWNDRKRTIGSYVAKAIELFEKGVLDFNTLDPAVKPYFDSYLLFRESGKYRVVLSEVPLYDPLTDTAGKPDLVIETVTPGLTLVEVKAGVPAPWHKLQTFGYKTICDANGYMIRYRLALYLNKRGKFPSIQKHEDYLEDEVAFHAMTNLLKWKEKNYGTTNFGERS